MYAVDLGCDKFLDCYLKSPIPNECPAAVFSYFGEGWKSSYNRDENWAEEEGIWR